MEESFCTDQQLSREQASDVERPPAAAAEPDPRRQTQIILTGVLAFAVAVALFLGGSALFLMTLGFDEAWMLLGVQGLVENGVYGHDLAAGTANTGGLYTLVESLLFAVFGADLPVLRIFSFASLLVLLGGIGRWTTFTYRSRTAGLLTAGVVLGVPGTLILGSTAYGTVPAVMLLFWGTFLWHRLKDTGHKRWLVCGAILGLGVATRLNCIFIFAALLGAALFSRERKQELRQAVATSLLGGLIASICHAILVNLAGSSEGIGLCRSLFDYPALMNRWLVANAFLPLPFLVATTIGYVFLDRMKRTVGMDVPEMGVQLLWFGWLSWGMWVLRSPIPHLRYLWPALAAFAFVLGICLAALHAWGKLRNRSLAVTAALLLSLTFVVTGCVSTLRHLLMGEANLLLWEWSHEAPLTRFRRLHHLNSQHQMAGYLRRHVAEDEVVGVLGLDLELTFLSGRTVRPFEWYRQRGMWGPEHLPLRLLVPPMVGTYLHLDPHAIPWIEANCKLLAQFGAYSLYEVTGRYPDDPDILDLSFRPAHRNPLSAPPLVDPL